MGDEALQQELARLDQGRGVLTAPPRPVNLQTTAPQAGTLDPHVSEVVKELLQYVPAIELLRFVSISEAARLSTLSEDSLARHYSDRVVDLGPRRRGMRIVDALLLRHVREGPPTAR